MSSVHLIISSLGLMGDSKERGPLFTSKRRADYESQELYKECKLEHYKFDVCIFAQRSSRIHERHQVTLAIVGIHGQGKSHFKDFCSIDGVRIKTICEVDENLFSGAQKMADSLTAEKIHFEPDIQRVLDDKDIDAISIATPNHWHSLMTVWACQAGKDVYVEKP